MRRKFSLRVLIRCTNGFWLRCIACGEYAASSSFRDKFRIAVETRFHRMTIRNCRLHISESRFYSRTTRTAITVKDTYSNFDTAIAVCFTIILNHNQAKGCMLFTIVTHYEMNVLKNGSHKSIGINSIVCSLSNLISVCFMIQTFFTHLQFCTTTKSAELTGNTSRQGASTIEALSMIGFRTKKLFVTTVEVEVGNCSTCFSILIDHGRDACYRYMRNFINSTESNWLNQFLLSVLP